MEEAGKWNIPFHIDHLRHYLSCINHLLQNILQNTLHTLHTLQDTETQSFLLVKKNNREKNHPNDKAMSQETDTHEETGQMLLWVIPVFEAWKIH